MGLGVNCAEHIIGGKFHSFSQEWGAWPYAGLSLLKVERKFNSNSSGADIAYICKHSACLYTQNVLTMFQQKLHLLVNSD